MNTPTIMHAITTTITEHYESELWNMVFLTATGALKAVTEELNNTIKSFDGEADEEEVELYEGDSDEFLALTISELGNKTLENGKSYRVVFACYEFHISTVGVGE